MSQPKITYLLGAGASANSVPVVSKLRDKFYEYRKTIKYNIEPKQNEFHINLDEVPDLFSDLKNNRDFYIKHIETLNSFFNDMKDFMTIDSYAKYLFLTNQLEKYNELKYHFSLFLFLTQILEFDITNLDILNIKFVNPNKRFIKVDKRYLKFLTTILQKDRLNLFFPDNIKFLSWNYDIQFELALNYFKLYFANIGVYPSSYIEHLTNNIILYHLNGTTGINYKSPFYDSIFKIFEDNSIVLEEFNYFTYFANYYKSYKNDILEYFRFAWEEKSLFKNDDFIENEKGALLNFKNHIKETEYLIIIGYSFPDFNVEFDKIIIDSINKEKLKAIYIQNTDVNCVNDFKNKMNFFDSSIKIHFVDNVDEFLTPYSIV